MPERNLERNHPLEILLDSFPLFHQHPHHTSEERPLERALWYSTRTSQSVSLLRFTDKIQRDVLYHDHLDWELPVKCEM